ncbi:Fcf2 pre-rRNA processing-domain-containing protein [Butyriboletus roseoflavus]|nr:Fcf2 pre-rRNA processing-domain-containing protein [Butyriboletus roseoflavus]
MSTAVLDKGKHKTVETLGGDFVAREQDSDARSSDSISDSDSDSDSNSSTPGDNTSDSNSDTEEDVTPEYLQSLLDEARRNAREEARRVKMLQEEKETDGFGEEEIIRISDGQEENPLPPLDPGVLPPPYFEFDKARHQAPTSVRDPDATHAEAAATSASVPAPPEDPNADWKQLTRKQRKALKNKTTGPGWFNLPAPAEADLPRLHREVEALRLRNQLDPKRFYRKDTGEGKGIKGLPKHFAIGTILPTTTPFGTASTDNLPRAHRKRTLVDELVDDAEARRYAKKKFDELQSVRGAKGKKTLHKKNDLRKPKW